MHSLECVRILVAYFSLTGTTEKVGRAIARALDADVEPIVDHTHRRGVVGYLRSAYQATFAHLAPIVPATRDPWTYDLVVVGTPIWNQALSSPARSYLERHEFHRIAFFCTCGGSGGSRVFTQMREAAGCDPVATLALREHDDVASAVARFAAQLRPLPPVREPEGERAVRE
jgi:flavodoxin